MINSQNYILIRVYIFLNTCAQPELCTKYEVFTHDERYLTHQNLVNDKPTN